MTKEKFLFELRRRLTNLPEEDIVSSLEYYGEMIDERIESGMSESDAVSAIGTPQAAAHEIMLDMPLTKIIKSKCKRKLSVFEIILLILGSPLWLSLIITAFAVILTIYIVIFSLIVAIWAIDAALAVSGICGIIISPFILLSSPMSSLIYFGLGLMGLGGGALMFFGSLWLSRYFIKLSVLIYKFIKSLIIGGNKEK